MLRFDVPFERLTTASFDDDAGVLACLDGYMNIAMEQTEVRFFFFFAIVARDARTMEQTRLEDHSFIRDAPR